MTFGDSNHDFSNADLSTTDVNGAPLMAVFWDDLTFEPDGTDAVYYETRGTLGSQIFIAQWNQVAGFGSAINESSLATFEAVLYEGSNALLIAYQDIDFGNDRTNGGSATVGIQGPEGQYLQWLANDVGEIEFDPPISSDQFILFSTELTVVPEPDSLALVGLGVLGFATTRIRRRRSAKPQFLECGVTR
jgi:hypothetical protein